MDFIPLYAAAAVAIAAVIGHVLYVLGKIDADTERVRAVVSDYDLRIIALRCGCEALRHCGPLQSRCQTLMGYCWMPLTGERARAVEALWCALYRLSEEQDVVVRAAVHAVLHAANDRASSFDRAREAVAALDHLSGMVSDAELADFLREPKSIDILA